MLHSPEDVQPPALNFRILVAKAFKWYPHLDFIPPIDDTSLRLEEVFRIEIHASSERIDVPKSPAGCRRTSRASSKLCAPRSVLLDTIRIDAEEERDLSRVVGIEQDLDLILAVDVVAVGVRRAHDVAVNLSSANPEVDRVGRVPHQNFSGLVRRTSIH